VFGTSPSIRLFEEFCNITGFITKVHEVIQFLNIVLTSGARGGTVVEALRYKPEDRGFDSRWCHWIFLST
jgi:hypothetical protein